MLRSVPNVWLALGLLAGCGDTGGARECTFNSDCPAGRYCTSAGTCTADCASDSECAATLGAGAVCSSFGQCVATPDAGREPDAGAPIDAGPRDSGARDASGPDARPDAGPPAEVCTPSAPGSVPADEDGDGAIDEECPWYFGRPHAVLPIAWAVLTGHPRCYGTFLDDTGLRLYVACSGGSAGAHTLVSERPARDRPFGPPTTVAFADAGLVTYEIVLEPGGLRGILQASPPGEDADLYRVERASIDAPFAASPIAALSSTESEVHPTLSRDGLELFFRRVSSGCVQRATRARIEDEFGAPSPVPDLCGQGLSLSDDGHDLFFDASPPGRPSTLYRAHRDDVTTASFDPPEEILALNPTGADELAMAHVSLATRELFFSTAGRAWAPASGRAIFRVQICRDGPCDEPLVECPPEGRRSPDGFHCYRPPASADPRIWGNAVRACASDGAHLATVTSAAEHALLFSTWGRAWVGGTDADGRWRWDWPGRITPEEPFLAGLWGPGEPNDTGGREDCAILEATGLNDGRCEDALAPICEDEEWPTW